MRILLGCILVLLCSCSDTLAPCEQWGSCRPANVVFRLTLDRVAFPPHHSRAGEKVWGPGDTVVITTAIENQTADTTPVFGLHSHWDGGGSEYYQPVMAPPQRIVAALLPGERVQYRDTLIIGNQTRGQQLRFGWTAYDTTTYQPNLEPLLEGDSIIPVLSSGFDLSVLIGPPATMMTVWGQTALWSRIRSNQEFAVRLRISNPYEAVVAPLTLQWFMIDVDYPPVHGYIPEPTPEVPSGEYRDMDLTFSLRNTDVRWFWQFLYTQLDICNPKWLPSKNCASVRIVLLPDFENLCAVQPISVDQPVTDYVKECDGTGSLYRFAGRKGEHYHVESVPLGAAFIVSADGIELDAPQPTELSVPADGTYYVVVDQRRTASVQITLRKDLNQLTRPSS